VSPITKINIPISYDPPVVSSPLLHSPPPLLEVYSQGHSSQQQPSNSLQVPSILSPPALTTEFDLPIVFHKGICSTRNPSLYYISFTYHRLCSHFYTCLSYISFVSILKSINDVLAHPS